MLFISHNVCIPSHEIDMQAIRAQGSGGQHVNKVSTAIHLRFDIKASSLPDFYKEKLLIMNDHHITKEGVIIIKSQEHRSQDMNRQLAQEKLVEIIRRAGIVQKSRRPTRPSRASSNKRMDKKTQKSKIKSMRGKVTY